MRSFDVSLTNQQIALGSAAHCRGDLATKNRIGMGRWKATQQRFDSVRLVLFAAVDPQLAGQFQFIFLVQVNLTQHCLPVKSPSLQVFVLQFDSDLLAEVKFCTLRT
jgi:hypothetical protein